MVQILFLFYLYYVTAIYDMPPYGLGEMLKCDFANMCGEKNSARANGGSRSFNDVQTSLDIVNNISGIPGRFYLYRIQIDLGQFISIYTQ